VIKIGFYSIIISALAVQLTGCASLIDSATQDVEFVTPGVIGADCRAENKKYSYNIYTPDIVTLERSYYPLTITCKAPGYETEIVQMPTEINETTAFNIVNGVIPGMAYDAGSRALMEYPDRIEIYMTPIAVEDETIVPLYEPADVPQYIPPPVPYQTETTVQEVMTGTKK